jgi:putative AdoMet-dependent methyltransferase
MYPNDPFSSDNFDSWAKSYDWDVQEQIQFPFNGYERVLETVVTLAEPQAGQAVLDLGTGTGNLALRFSGKDCKLWCTDFSEAMLEKARKKLPLAHFIVADLRAEWPPELNRSFDRIISAYVFHHFELNAKVNLCRELVTNRLAPNGKLIVADLSFPDSKTMGKFAKSVGELWEDEPYWLADKAMDALKNAGMDVTYQQISPCAGIYLMKAWNHS